MTDVDTTVKALIDAAHLTMSDELALGALKAADRHGIAVPDQLAITGWDASELRGGS